MSCTLCQSPQYSVVRDKVRHNIERKVLRCAGCGFVYLERRPSPSTEFYSGKTYRQVYGPMIDTATNPQDIFDTYFPFQDDIIRQIQSILRPDMKVLDVGCSTGHFLASLKEKVEVRVGMEFNKDEVAFIREHLDFPVYTDPIETVRMTEGPFDLITALQVLEHVEDPITFLRSLDTHLAPGGYLYLELPNIHDILIEYYQVSGYLDFYYREPHLSYFSKESLRFALKEAGFDGKITTIQRYSMPNHMNWVMTNMPQGNYALGNGDGACISATDVPDIQTKETLNDFFRKTNQEYLRLVSDLGLGESLVFFGQKVSR